VRKRLVGKRRLPADDALRNRPGANHVEIAMDGAMKMTTAHTAASAGNGGKA
jgi:hypothetical protein